MAGTYSFKAERSPNLRHEASVLSQSEAGWLAWYMCAVSLVLTALGLLLLVLSREAYLTMPVFEQWAEDAVVAVGFSTLGAVVAPRFPPKNPIAWLFCAIGLVAAVQLFSGEYAYYSLLARFGSLPGGEAIAWITSWLWVVHVGLFAFLALLFPDGRPPTPRWRLFAWLVGAAVVDGHRPAQLVGQVVGAMLGRRPDADLVIGETRAREELRESLVEPARLRVRGHRAHEVVRILVE